MESETEIVEKPVSTVFKAVSLDSSEDPPMDEWSSLEIVFEETNPKRILEEEGLYDPGTPEICSKYVALSASSVIRHVYYRYPAIVDPGIRHALLDPEDQITYPDDGQDLYLAVCKEMEQCVVRCFHRGLLKKEIDLRYYCVNPKGVRAMAYALKYNNHVQKLSFTENFLTIDACWHLGDMLKTNTCMVHLNLTGCRIGPMGVRHLLHGLVTNKTVTILNLSGNEIGDDGMVYFANAVFKGLVVTDVNLSHNNISGKGVSLLAEPFQAYNKITDWDLSWNNLYSAGTTAFLNALADTSTALKTMNMSWNGLGPESGWGIRRLLKTKEIEYLDVSHNLLANDGVKDLCGGLSSAKKLKYLNLGFNPMSPGDAYRVIRKMKLKTVKVLRVNMENIKIDQTCVALLQEVKEIKPTLELTHGYVLGTFKGVGPDYRDILFKRVDYLCQKPKKNKTDIALVLLALKKERITSMLVKEFFYMLYKKGAPVDQDLIFDLCSQFAGPKTAKGDKTVNISALAEYSSRLYPDRKLPPTPPPEPEPTPPPPPTPPTPEKKGKGKAKK